MLVSVPMSTLISPHGGCGLRPLALAPGEAADAVRRAQSLPRLTVSSREKGDVIMMGIGGFTPLEGFMSRADWAGVCDDMRTSDGTFWPIPITLSTDAQTAQTFADGSDIALIDPDDDSVLALIGALASTASAATFAVALDPPRFLRTIWRRPEQEGVQAAIGELMRAEDEQDVVARVLGPMAELVGASTVTLVGPNGAVLGSHASHDDGHIQGESDTRSVEVDGLTLRVRTSRYAPFFGTEELGLLRTLGSLTALALDHARLLAGERAARAALERADELRTQFVAFAALQALGVAGVAVQFDDLVGRDAGVLVQVVDVLGDHRAHLAALHQARHGVVARVGRAADPAGAA